MQSAVEVAPGREYADCMCGIAGAFTVGGPERPPLSHAILDAMTDAMTHRGPDDRGTFIDHGAAIGARRLSIIDVVAGHQPFSDESGDIWAAQNGEIFNHDVLRTDLLEQGHQFKTRCDTEILPHLYETHGDDFPKRLRGMFAVALWDGRRRRGLIVRDRLGIKPLYYAQRDGLLLFASELKGLLASGLIDGELDPVGLELYLTLGMVPAPWSLVRGVRKLPPGHTIVIDGGDVAIRQYWEYPTVAGPSRGADVGAHADRLLEALRESVRLRLMSDVPLGAMLSGGLDSSLIVALMTEQMTEPVKTFAVGFAGSPTSELADAREVAARLGADHHELEIEEASASLEELVWHLDEPLADLSALGFLALCRLARQHVTVALSGQGADELFAGYRHHLHAPVARLWERVPNAIGKPFLALAGRGPVNARRFAEVAGAGDAVSRALAAKRTADDGEVAMLLGRQHVNGAAARAAIASFRGADSRDPLAAALAIDAQMALPDDMLHYFDRGSMAHSLEVRVPFLDHPLVEQAASIPANLKLHGRTTKYVLRQAARGLVPDRIIDKPKVGFFNASAVSWIARVIEREGRDLLLPREPRYADYVDRTAVERLRDAQRQAPTRRRAQLLLSIVLLETWLQTYLPRALGDPAATPRKTAVTA
jgi:asparagine synthase (glutamine-hydrolysing)